MSENPFDTTPAQQRPENQAPGLEPVDNSVEIGAATSISPLSTEEGQKSYESAKQEADGAPKSGRAAKAKQEAQKGVNSNSGSA